MPGGNYTRSTREQVWQQARGCKDSNRNSSGQDCPACNSSIRPPQLGILFLMRISKSGLHQPPWSFGFDSADSQTRGTGETGKVPGSFTGPIAYCSNKLSTTTKKNKGLRTHTQRVTCSKSVEYLWRRERGGGGGEGEGGFIRIQ